MPEVYTALPVSGPGGMTPLATPSAARLVARRVTRRVDVAVLLVLAVGVRHLGDVLAPTETYRATAAGHFGKAFAERSQRPFRERFPITHEVQDR